MEVLSSVVVAYHLPNRGKRGVRLWDCWEEEIKVLVSRVETMTKVMTIDGVKGLSGFRVYCVPPILSDLILME